MLDPNDPDHRLVWPREVLLDELDRRLSIMGTARGRRDAQKWSAGTDRLLRTAFAGPSVAEEFQAVQQRGYYSGGPFSDVPEAFPELNWLHDLRSELADFESQVPERSLYWSQRKRGVSGERLSFEVTARRFVAMVRTFDTRDLLWSEAFGVDCPDGVGDPVSSPAEQVAELLERDLPGFRWPLPEDAAGSWDHDDLYDAIELLHDLASWPSVIYGHDWGGCVGHPTDFSPRCGQDLFRHHVNALLARSELGVVVGEIGPERGRIITPGAPDLEESVRSAVEEAPEGYSEDVQHAVMMFRARDRNVASMRSAITALAGVLEAHRALLKAELLTKDEGYLFDIANNFDLRHRKADQRSDYDPAFLEWIFHWYLATIPLVSALMAKQQAPPEIPESDGWDDVDEEPF